MLKLFIYRMLLCVVCICACVFFWLGLEGKPTTPQHTPVELHERVRTTLTNVSRCHNHVRVPWIDMPMDI